MSRLLVISHTPHYFTDDGSLVGWGPTIRELDYLAEAFGEVDHVAPLYRETAPMSAIPYRNSNIQYIPINPSGGRTLIGKLGILKNFPRYLSTINKALLKADIVQIRCPCNIAISALLYLSVNRKVECWAKYGGNWVEDYPPLSFRFQRWWLTHGLHHGPVTLNGRWAKQPRNAFSFYNPCLTLSEVKNAKKLAKNKKFTEPYKHIFIGNLNDGKGIGRAIEIVTGLRQKGFNCQLDVIGDGPGLDRYKQKAEALNIQDAIRFLGWLSRDSLASYYAESHFLLLPSLSEGFPKVISEAMAYGVVPVAGAVSSIPQVLSELKAGTALPPKDVFAYIGALQGYISKPEMWKQNSAAGIKSAKLFTFENYIVELDKMFHNFWGVSQIKNNYTGREKNILVK